MTQSSTVFQINNNNNNNTKKLFNDQSSWRVWEKRIFKLSWNLLCFSDWVIYVTQQRAGWLLCEMFSSASSGHHREQEEEICPSATWNFLAAAAKAELWELSCKRLKKKKGKKPCLDHLLRAELTHSAGFCASKQQRWPRVRLGLIDDAPDVPKHHSCPWSYDFFFSFVVPLWAFNVTQTDFRWSKAAGCFASSMIPPQRGGGVKGVHAGQALCDIEGH